MSNLERRMTAGESTELLYWMNDVSDLSREERRLTESGYKMFFERVLVLPINQSSASLDNYKESDLNLVAIRSEDLRGMSEEQIRFLRRVQDVIDFWPPYNLGVFGINDDRSEIHKGSYSRTAQIVVQSPYGEVFRNQKVIYVNHEFNSFSGEQKGSISVTNFGFITGQPKELPLLQAANVLIDVYSRKLQSSSST